MKIKLDWGTLDGNHHGPRVESKDADDGYYFETLRSTWKIVALGRDFYMKSEGRRLFGRRLWIYGPTGACVRFDVMVRFDKSPCTPGSKYGPKDDGGIGTIVL